MALVYLGIHICALCVFWTGITWTELLLCVALLQVRGFCVSAGYHRLLAHRSFATSRVFQFLLAAGACASLRGGPLWWVALHRHHHRHSDTDDDVFCPDKGFWWSYGAWLVSGDFARTDYARVPDLARYPELRWLNRFWLVPTMLLIGAVVLWGGFSGFVTVYCLSTVILFHTMAWIDALNHLVGEQRYDTADQSRNNYWLALICNGEGWHNNHHHYPASANYGFFRGEVDGAYSVLKLLAVVGVVWNLKTPPAAVLRRGLVADSPDRVSTTTATEMRVPLARVHAEAER